MPKALTIAGMVVSALILILFGLDMATGIPFSTANSTMDIAFIVCAVLLGYMSWSAYRDVK